MLLNDEAPLVYEKTPVKTGPSTELMKTAGVVTRCCPEPWQDLLPAGLLCARWQCDSRLSATNLIKPRRTALIYRRDERGPQRQSWGGAAETIGLPGVILAGEGEGEGDTAIDPQQGTVIFSHLIRGHPIITHIHQRCIMNRGID